MGLPKMSEHAVFVADRLLERLDGKAASLPPSMQRSSGDQMSIAVTGAEVFCARISEGID
jgi:hypothetical protein